MDRDCIIIGGGASGLMLAAALDLGGRNGLLLEKTSRPGTKLLLSGGGRCNITHGGSIKEFISAYGASGAILRKCLYAHNNIALVSWLEDAGISLADERGEPVFSYGMENAGRIFPASMKASEILDLLLGRARLNGWEIRTEAGVYDLARSGDEWIVSASPADTYAARNVVIATGGITYPETGSDGSMFDIVRSMGIEVTPLRSSLAPVYVEDYPYEELSGVTIPDVTATVFTPGNHQKAARMTGDMLFTHRGFSGPLILNISRFAEPGGLLSISYNKDINDLPRRLQRVLESRAAGPSGDVRTTVLSALLERDIFAIAGVDEHGMVTAGGISLGEIETRSMQIIGHEGLYAVGEALDADGITGGYNLQLCWSTAMSAADSIRERLTQ